MGKYNFDELIDRRGTFSCKWDAVRDKDILPLWIADMDFRAAPPIVEAVKKCAELGVYGYALENDAFYDAIIGFHKRHYGQKLQKEWIMQVPGLVPALTAVLQALTQCGDELIVQTPGYNCFFSSIRNSGLVCVENPLLYDKGRFSIDYELLEKQASHARAKVMLLCNPHNPSGRLWKREELLGVLEIARKHNLYVISDEIHCDIRPNNSLFTAFSTLDESFNSHLITLNSPGKTFNLAGLKSAYVICENKELRYRIDRQININEICDPNVFGIASTIASYTECDDYLRELNDYIQDNFKYLRGFFEKNYPDFIVTPLESTYLAWINCSPLGLSGEEIRDRLLKEAKLYINDGEMYKSPLKGFIRINLATPRERLADALERFKKVF